jgi:hypothetical protein
LLTGLTGISLHMQWPLTSQLHGSVSQREQFGIFYNHWVYTYWTFGNFVVIWCSFPRFGILYKEKSGNPGLNAWEWELVTYLSILSFYWLFGDKRFAKSISRAKLSSMRNFGWLADCRVCFGIEIKHVEKKLFCFYIHK